MYTEKPNLIHGQRSEHAHCPGPQAPGVQDLYSIHVQRSTIKDYRVEDLFSLFFTLYSHLLIFFTFLMFCKLL